MNLPPNLHSPLACADHPCPWHHPSAHHMIVWPMTVRYDRYALTERVCEHGIGHPDPDSVAFLSARLTEDFQVHGCDGCCVPPDPNVAAALESFRRFR